VAIPIQPKVDPRLSLDDSSFALEPGGEAVEGQQDLAVLGEAVAGFWIIRLARLEERVEGLFGVLAAAGQANLVDAALGRALQLLGMLVCRRGELAVLVGAPVGLVEGGGHAAGRDEGVDLLAVVRAD